MASGTAIAAAGKAAGLEDSRAVFAAAAQGNAAARAIVERATRATGVAAWTILHTFLPERIVLGGGIIEEHYELFAAPVRDAIAAAVQTPRAHLAVVKAQLGNDAGLLGAASLALQSAV
jgi:glucokinase